MHKFIDLFAGIGGIRIAFEKQGCECVFSSEWDAKAQETYSANFGEVPHGDIQKISSEEIPDHDILLAGFPCQPFSLAGVSKKNALGRKHGFADETQGTLFFEVARIIRDKRPKAFLLENVKNLRSHDNYRTFRTIMRVLQRELGYKVYDAILDAKGLLPQHRERIYLVGFREHIHFEFPQLPTEVPPISSILEENVDDKYTLTDNLWKYLQNYAEKHQKAGNGFGYGLVDLNGPSRTLSARYYKDGSEILIPQEGKNPRRLTPSECARLQGFPDDFKIIVSDAAAYKQFGNSVPVPVVEKIAESMMKALEENIIVEGYDRSKLQFSEIRDEAIARASQYGRFFCKFISANDTGKTGGHQSGFYVPKNAWPLLFEQIGQKNQNMERSARIYWEQLDFHTDNMFKWYGKGSRSEYRITRFGKGFPFFTFDHIGDLLIIIQVNSGEYVGYVLSGEDSEAFLETFSISPVKNAATYGLGNDGIKDDETQISLLIEEYVGTIEGKFPTPRQIAAKSRELFYKLDSGNKKGFDRSDSDSAILRWLDIEYQLFKALEKQVYRNKLSAPFNDLDSLLEFANVAVDQRRRRSGKSFEFHMEYILQNWDLDYSHFNGTTKKGANFVFPSDNFEIPLITLTTCKYRWKHAVQFFNGTDPVYLVTLDKGLNPSELDQIEKSNVILVVPENYHSMYPVEFRDKLLTISQFCTMVQEKTKQISIG